MIWLMQNLKPLELKLEISMSPTSGVINFKFNVLYRGQKNQQQANKKNISSFHYLQT